MIYFGRHTPPDWARGYSDGRFARPRKAAQSALYDDGYKEGQDMRQHGHDYWRDLKVRVRRKKGNNEVSTQCQ